jgi:pimeloyl-ACP methyl ester carboxylesterase
LEAVRIVYLHGFASSPQSGKAQFFSRRFRDLGFDVEIPALDEGDFSKLTITGQLGVIQSTVAERPAVLMGSSLGGYLAALFAARHQIIEKLILMAPAFQFARRWRERYPAQEMERWKRTGFYPIFHYGTGREMPLGYHFVEDSRQYEDEPEFAQPALILHGLRDPVVPADVSEQFASRRSNALLRLFDSGHELTDVLEPMWNEICSFLELRRFQTS